MQVNFSVYGQKKDVTLEVKVLSTVPVKDTFVLISRYEEQCNLMNNKDSAPYHTHLVRAVDHLVYGSVELVKRRGLVLAACLCGSGISYALVRQDYFDDNISLGTSSDDWEGVSGDRIELFNYEQYAASRRALALDVPSMNDYLSDLISSNTVEHRSVRYDIRREREVKIEELLTDSGLIVWLDEEEKRTSELT